MTTVAVYFNNPGKLDYPFDNPSYVTGYRDFTQYCAQSGLDLVIVRGGSYLGNMSFRTGWRFVGDDLVESAQPIAVDLIYNKELEHDLITNPGDLVINDPVFDKIGRDKWLTSQAFPDLCPLTFQIDTQNWRDVIARINSDRVVLKPISGNEGRGIIIEQRTDLDFPGLALTVPYIAQEFIDSSNGIPGLCTGLHDLRIVLFGGAPKLAYIRQPKPGSLLANVAQGGSVTMAELDKVPPSVLDYVRRIDTYYAQYPYRIYSADFFFQGDRPYLIEINTRPGLFRRRTHGEAPTNLFYHSLAQVFTDAIKQRSK